MSADQPSRIARVISGRRSAWVVAVLTMLAALAVLGSDRYGERFWAIMGSQIAVPSAELALPVLPARAAAAIRLRPRQRVRSSIMD